MASSVMVPGTVERPCRTLHSGAIRSQNKSTSVDGTGTKTWAVILKKGSYHYQCDVHPTIMKGDFKVS